MRSSGFALDRLAEFELIAYRQHMVTAGRRPATINRPPGRPAPPVPMGARHRRVDVY
jgi:hypothetical protein